MAIALFWSYLEQPGDQVILLSIIALPTDILFFFVARSDWSAGTQFAFISLLGFVQYGLLGVLVSSWIAKRREK
jgi:hypothetical protein